MQLIPDDHDWQSFSDAPKDVAGFIHPDWGVQPLLMHLAKWHRKALAQFENATDGVHRLEALQMLFVINQAFGVVRHDSVMAEVEDRREKAEAQAELGRRAEQKAEFEARVKRYSK